MKAEELLKPRYKVIAGYPNTTHNIGDILDDGGRTKIATKHWVIFMDQYPHLFRKLEWWEHREEKDMPKLIRKDSEGAKIEVNEWDMSRGSILIAKINHLDDIIFWCGKPNYYPVD